MKLTALIFNMMIALFVGSIALASGVEPGTAQVVTGVTFGVTMVPKTMIAQGALMAVEVEVWEDYIADNLFETFPWLLRSRDRSGSIISGPAGVQVVHIPQAGTPVNVVKNRSNYPVPVVVRNDADVTYSLDKFSTDAVLIPDAEKVQLSYDKMGSVLKDHRGAIDTAVAGEFLRRWSPTVAANIIRSTGASTAVYISTQTGNRKKFLAADLASAKTRIRTTTKRKSGLNLVAIMTEGAYNQLKSDPTVTAKETMDSVGAVWKDGELVKLHGFDLYQCEEMPLWAADASGLKAENANGAITTAATDQDAILCYAEDYVHRAVGNVKFFENGNDAAYQGDYYSAYVMAGGRIERSDEAGIVAIVQTT